MNAPLFFPADAHEGPVWVSEQCRLYYTTKTHLDGRRRVDIEYLDFSAFGNCDDHEFGRDLPDDAPARIKPHLWVHDAKMANSMCLSKDRRQLLVCEQGYEDQAPSVLARYNLADKSRSVVIADYRGTPFNSLNKVIVTRAGHIIVSDPDYGFRQDFKPPPQLEPNLYILPKGGELEMFRCNLEMPHGLALSPDERTLFVTDTSNDGAHGDDIDLKRHKSVWKFGFDPETATISGPGEFCFQVDEGVPDGMETTADCLLAGGGDAVYVANLAGELLGKIDVPNDAVNLALAGGGKHLFVTNDKGVLLYRDWRTFMQGV